MPDISKRSGMEIITQMWAKTLARRISSPLLAFYVPPTWKAFISPMKDQQFERDSEAHFPLRGSTFRADGSPFQSKGKSAAQSPLTKISNEFATYGQTWQGLNSLGSWGGARRLTWKWKWFTVHESWCTFDKQLMLLRFPSYIGLENLPSESFFSRSEGDWTNQSHSRIRRRELRPKFTHDENRRRQRACKRRRPQCETSVNWSTFAHLMRGKEEE